MTVLLLQLEGDDETLQAGFKALENALDNIGGSREARVLPGRAVADAAALPGVLETENDDIEDAPPPARSSRVRKVEAPNLLDDLDLGGTNPLKEFVSDISPTKQNLRYLVIAYWLKHCRDINEVCRDHIHTGFRHMGWHSPRDVTQPLRNMTSKLDWFRKEKGGKKGHYAITHIGEDEVHKLRGGE